MLRPIFAQQYRRGCHVRKELGLALLWWAEVLMNGVRETRIWKGPAEKVVRMYADARSTPPRIAVVVVYDGRCD